MANCRTDITCKRPRSYIRDLGSVSRPGVLCLPTVIGASGGNCQLPERPG